MTLLEALPDPSLQVADATRLCPTCGSTHTTILTPQLSDLKVIPF